MNKALTRTLRAMAVGTGLWLAASTTPAQEKPTLTGGHFAEGYSSPDAKTPVDVAHRMFTTSMRDCEELEPLPTRLEPSPREIVVRVGEQLALPKLVVEAVDSSGRVIPRAPIALTIAYEPSLLWFESDQFRYFSITGVRPGNAGHVIAQLLCGPDYSIKIPIRVLP